MNSNLEHDIKSPIPLDEINNFGKSPIRTFTNYLPSLEGVEDFDSKIFLIGVAGGSASGKSTVSSQKKVFLIFFRFVKKL